MTSAIEVPYRQLSEQALSGLIEEFINREGTDYGEYEYSLDDKATQVRVALAEGKAVIVFDPVIETSTLMYKDQFQQFGC
ncbi:MAG: hypothetical protein ACJA0N_000234 [Pseudohongiellaceae bacterium]|jgi:uncharacterized protein YheU (UPF0270 family)